MLLGGREEPATLPNWLETTFAFKLLFPWDRHSGNLSPYRPCSSSSGLPVQLLPKCPSPVAVAPVPKLPDLRCAPSAARAQHQLPSTMHISSL